MKELKKHLQAIIIASILLILIGFVVFMGISIRESKNHCIPKSGIVNDAKSFIMGELGFRGLRCQLGNINSYTSTKYGFSINFPGNPTVTNTSDQLQGGSIAITKYESFSSNGNLGYAVEVYVYSSNFDLSNVKTSLQGVLANEVKSEKATLVSSSFGTLAGYTTLTGHLKGNASGQTFDIYGTNLLKGNTLFKIVTINVNRSDFNNFVNSFKFKG